MLVLSLSSDMSHNLTCTAIGNPRPTMMWLLNNAPLQMSRNQVSLILYHLLLLSLTPSAASPPFSLRVALLLYWILSAVLMVVPILVLLLILSVWI